MDWSKNKTLSQLGRENRNSANWPCSTLDLSPVGLKKGVENVNVTPAIFTLFNPSHPFADFGPEIMTSIWYRVFFFKEGLELNRTSNP